MTIVCGNDKNSNVECRIIMAEDKRTVCLYCGGGESAGQYCVESIFGDEFSVVRCGGCGAYFLSPAVTDEQLAQAYDDSYYGDGESKFGGLTERAVEYFRGLRSVRVERFINRGGRVLDIGCGNGGFLESLIKRGFEGYGVELEGGSAERAKRVEGLCLKVGAIEEADFEEDFFDAVCMWHVFEHVRDPRKVLGIIKKVLKPGGVLFISMPNIESFQSKLFKGRWFHLDVPRHLCFFGPGDLESKLGEFGFEVVGRSFFSLEQNVFGIQQSILNCIMKKREVLYEALKGSDRYDGQHLRWSILLQQFFLIATFPLFAVLAGLESAFGRGGTMEYQFKIEKD